MGEMERMNRTENLETNGQYSEMHSTWSRRERRDGVGGRGGRVLSF